MSTSAAHESKKLRRNCESCRLRKARFRYRGIVRTDRDHTLCFACYRAVRDRRRAQMLAERQPAMLRSPFGRVLTESQVDHRRRMLDFAMNRGTYAANR
jgi:hypothetical protein